MAAPGGALTAWVDGVVLHEPMPGVPYPAVLVVDDTGRGRLRKVLLGVGGPMLGLFTYVVVAPWLVLAVMGLFWVGEGRSGQFVTWAGQLTSTFAEPSGMAAAHLGLAVLIPISMGLVLFVHRFHPRWLHSVQPGFRWRFGLVALAAALVIFGVVWALSQLGQSWTVHPEPALWGFLLVIVLTSPLQAAAEEYFFRGYVLQALQTALPGNSWFAIAASSLVFAVMHGTQDLPAFLYRLLFGVVAAWLVLKTGGLEAGIAAHVANNLLTFGWAALSGTMVATRTSTSTTWTALGLSLAGFVAFAAAAVWIARRMKVATTTPGVRFGARGAV